MKTDRATVEKVASQFREEGTDYNADHETADLLLALLAEKEAADAVIAETHNELARTYTRAYAAEAARDANQVAANRYRMLRVGAKNFYGMTPEQFDAANDPPRKEPSNG